MDNLSHNDMLEQIKFHTDKSDELSQTSYYDEAISHSKKALQLCEMVYGNDHFEVVELLNKLSVLYKLTSQYDKSEQLLQKALEVNRKLSGPDHPDVAKSLCNLAVLYESCGRYDEAETHALKALKIRKAALSEDHPDIADSLDTLAVLYVSTGRYDDAEPLLIKALKIREQKFGQDHLDVATSLNNMAGFHELTGQYNEAEQYYLRALKIHEKQLGINHPGIVGIINNLVSLYRSNGQLAKAEQYANRALEICELKLDSEHLDLASTLNNLAGIYESTGRYEKAEPLYFHALEIWKQKLGESHPNVATIYNNLGGFYDCTGQYNEAEKYILKALQTYRLILGEEHHFVAATLHNLAMLYESTGRYSEAEPLILNALEIWEKTLGEDNPYVAKCLNNLGGLYQNTGRYTEAEQSILRALEIIKIELGEDHPEFATSLHNLAMLYESTGRYLEAEPLILEELEIKKATFGEDHPSLATSLHNLGMLYESTGRIADAFPLLFKALEIQRRFFGEEHSGYARFLGDLAFLFHRTGNYAEAELHYLKALEIKKKTLGEYHPDVAETLNNLALLYGSIGRHSEVEALYKRALGIVQQKLDGDHPIVSTAIFNMAMFYMDANDNSKAQQYFDECFTSFIAKLDETLILLSERQKLNIVCDNEIIINGIISNALLLDSYACKSVKTALNAWLRWKGIVTEAQGRYVEALSNSDNTEIHEMFNRLTIIQREIARLNICRPEKLSPGEYKEKINCLRKQKEELEVNLNQLSKEFALERIAGKADIERIARILPQDSVYLDFARIRTYNIESKKFNDVRYLCFVLIPGEEITVKLFNLSCAEEIEQQISAYHHNMHQMISTLVRYSEPNSDLHQESATEKEFICKLDSHAKTLYELIFTQLEAYIFGRREIYISPDASLHLIPFEVLVTTDGRRLLQDHLIHYIANGRDIVRFDDTSKAKNEAIIIADPDYDMSLNGKENSENRDAINEESIQSLINKLEQLLVNTNKVDALKYISDDAFSMHFSRLPETKDEADRIERIINESYCWKVNNFQDKNAVEEKLFTAESPKVLHLSTHGFFFKDENIVQADRQGFLAKNIYNTPDAGIENPMLRSGIVFAGVNTSLRNKSDYGFVSAEKILGLKLKGTELVVLSACETGLGAVQTGEGVFGLKRAFILSGAKTLVMSLWQVPSKETTELMIDFYTHMADGKTKAEALRQAKFNMMSKKSNPFFWGAFVMVGNPRQMLN